MPVCNVHTGVGAGLAGPVLAGSFFNEGTIFEICKDLTCAGILFAMEAVAAADVHGSADPDGGDGTDEGEEKG